MDADRFDFLSRSLSVAGSRRGALIATLVGSLGLLSLTHPDDAVAGRKCKPRCGACQKCKKRKCHQTDHGKVCKKGKCKPQANGTPCGGGACQSGACVGAPAPRFCPPPARDPAESCDPANNLCCGGRECFPVSGVPEPVCAGSTGEPCLTGQTPSDDSCVFPNDMCPRGTCCRRPGFPMGTAGTCPADGRNALCCTGLCSPERQQCCAPAGQNPYQASGGASGLVCGDLGGPGESEACCSGLCTGSTTTNSVCL